MDNALRPTFGFSTALATASVLLALAPYVMIYAPWHFDTAVFGGPAVSCVLFAFLFGVAGVTLAIRRVEFVPNWLWATEVVVAGAAILLVLNLLRLW